MFERFTEKARRVIFFARFEASNLASPYIDIEALFLGMMGEAPGMLKCFGLSPESMQTMRREIEQRSRAAQGDQKVSTSADLPMNNECTLALARGSDEADALQDQAIGPEHLFLGLLQTDDSPVVHALQAQGVDYESVREQFPLGPAKQPEAPSLEKTVARLRKLLSQGKRDLHSIKDVEASRPLKAGGWNPKQVLGHLIDSVSNNHQRLVRALIQPELVWPNYEQDSWVATQHYTSAGWESLVNLWISYNRHLLWIVLHIPEDKTGTSCRIGDNPPMTLAEMVSSYADHLEHHLNQIASRAGGHSAGAL